ncbi:tRNA (guanine(6)-N2)-methyltransferase THUMP3 isoform X2 [Malaclemys terrapin pileata]|uniref:tRNA (guanine(6)-N2)-methyltransferase THUMP3 isoform X2 n=1 Tax=Malaclemys terrapin pileata TaxID=2991368 RepID=UPI0023A8903A|nr:tRNA (guanine(6)-N2)-methyltransferase THUMP3 isoform X2 [Malaclemys terrapin pileata]
MSDTEEASDTLAEVNLDDTHKPLTENLESDPTSSLKDIVVTIGATVPTGFELTAADEVKEKLGSQSRISKDRGKIYFEISVEKLSQVHRLRSVDNLFVVVQEFTDYQFKETKEDALKDLEDLAKKLPWTDPLKVWKLNTSLKKRKTKHKKQNQQNCASKEKLYDDGGKDRANQKDADKELLDHAQNTPSLKSAEQNTEKTQEMILADDQSDGKDEFLTITGNENQAGDCKKGEVEAQVLKFRVTCNRAGDKHCFTSNDAARDFGGAVQDYFQWKADMTNFDVEVLLNIHNNEVVVGIALTEESLHRRNITHFGPTTLRSTLAYGMLRLCDPQPTDIIIDPMSGTGAIPIEGATEWPSCYHIAGDNNPQAVKRAANNICSLLKKNQNKESGTSWGIPIDTIQWDICNLPLRTSSVDVIVTDMPFGKRPCQKWDTCGKRVIQSG